MLGGTGGALQSTMASERQSLQNLPLPSCPGDHMWVLLSFCLQLRQKGMRNAKENSSPLPSKMSAAEFTL